MNFFDILYARKNGDALSANFFDLLFAKATVFDVWEVYDGTLPAQFSANGDDLKAYKVFGNTGGVGKETVNICDKSELYLNTNLNPSPSEWLYQVGQSSVLRIPCLPSTTYTVRYYNDYPNMSIFRIFETSSDNTPTSSESSVSATSLVIADSQPSEKKATVTTSANAKYLLFRTSAPIMNDVLNELVITEGSTAPESYVPYGYEVDVETRENLFNKNDLRPNESTLNEYGAIYTNAYCSVSPFIPINGGSTYYIRNADTAAFCWYNEEKEYISGERYDDRQQFATTAPQNAAYIRCTVTNETTITTNRNIDTFMLTESGQETATPIYIGSTALEKDEYVDSSSGKVYKRTKQLVKGYRQGSSNTFERLTRVTSTNLIPAISGQSVSIKLYDTISGYQFAIWGMNQAGAEEFETTGLISSVNVTYDSSWKSPYFKCTDTNSFAYAITIRMSGDPAITPETVEGVLCASYGKIEDVPSTYVPYLQPTDQPVPLPAIPTVDGSTIVEVNSVVQPEKVYFEYKKR